MHPSNDLNIKYDILPIVCSIVEKLVVATDIFGQPLPQKGNSKLNANLQILSNVCKLKRKIEKKPELAASGRWQPSLRKTSGRLQVMVTSSSSSSSAGMSGGGVGRGARLVVAPPAVRSLGCAPTAAATPCERGCRPPQSAKRQTTCSTAAAATAAATSSRHARVAWPIGAG